MGYPSSPYVHRPCKSGPRRHPLKVCPPIKKKILSFSPPRLGCWEEEAPPGSTPEQTLRPSSHPPGTTMGRGPERPGDDVENTPSSPRGPALARGHPVHAAAPARPRARCKPGRREERGRPAASIPWFSDSLHAGPRGRASLHRRFLRRSWSQKQFILFLHSRRPNLIASCTLPSKPKYKYIMK